MSEPAYGMGSAVRASTTGTETSPATRGPLVIGDGQISVAEGVVQKVAGPPLTFVIDGVDVEAVAAAVQGCAGVSALDSGQFGEIASYLPGQRVPGVAVRDRSVLVGVRSRWGVRAVELFAQIASAVAPLIGRRWVEVTIGDIDDPPAPGRVPPPP